MADIQIERNTIIRGLMFLVVVKTFLLFFFSYERDVSYDKKGNVVNNFALKTSDSSSYLLPLENYAVHGDYNTLCRMPGYVPFYMPLRWFFDEGTTQVVVVFIQFLADIISALLLAIIAARLFNSKRAFALTILLYGINTFIAIRTNFLLSDSFCVSLLIIGFYFLSTYCITEKTKHLLLGGAFLCWAFLFRIPVILSYPAVAAILLWKHKSFGKAVVKSFVFTLPLLLSLTLWTIRNKTVYNRTIVLIPHVSECMGGYTYEQEAMRNFIITMGEDYQRWAPNSAAEWFWQDMGKEKVKHPFSANDFTSEYNLDSLLVLKADFEDFAFCKDPALRPEKGVSVIERSNRYAESYKKEHPFRYYVVNRINFFKMFMFPSRMDDVPLPPYHKMNLLHKLVKGGGYLHFIFFNLLGLIAMLFFWYKRSKLLAAWSVAIVIPLLFLGLQGFIEQRYSATFFPFLVVFGIGLIDYGISIFQKRKPVLPE